jgi:thymidylate synthase (FAD)
MKYSVKVVGKTIPLIKGVETITDFIAYQAKVSNPEGQFKKTNLLDYLKRRKEWSPFEMASIQVEVEAPRDISRQMLRHTSARFQEFSQRYAEVQNFTVREIRSQDTKNRQNSIDDFSKEDQEQFEYDCEELIGHAKFLYDKWIKAGGAKECCRVFLPEGLTMSRLYMSAPVRTWIHYLDLREEEGVTQKEHVMIANAIREELHKIEPDLF